MAVLTPQEPSRTWTAEDVMVTEPSVIRRAIGAASIAIMAKRPLPWSVLRVTISPNECPRSACAMAV